MAEEPGELAGKVNGVIPFLFFDLIARVAPGLLLFFALSYEGENKLTQALGHVVFNGKPPSDSPAAWIAVLLVAGYILGHGISPMVKLLDRKDDELSQQYNDLRQKFPGVTPIAMRIRAEYIMYGGFAVSLLIAIAVAVLKQVREILISAHGLRGWWSSATHAQHFDSAAHFFVALGATWLMLYRNQQTIETYRNTVKELHRAADLSKCNNTSEVAQNELTRTHRFLLLIRVRSKPKPKSDSASHEPSRTVSEPVGNIASHGPHPS